MNEEKLKQILNKIAQADVPPNAALIVERASRNFDTALKISHLRQWYFTPVRLVAAAAVIVIAFAAGRWSKSEPQMSPSPEVSYAQRISLNMNVEKNGSSFWQQKALAAMQPRPYAHAQFDQSRLLNAYKQYLKDRTSNKGE
jgi:citrate synthase